MNENENNTPESVEVQDEQVAVASNDPVIEDPAEANVCDSCQ